MLWKSVSATNANASMCRILLSLLCMTSCAACSTVEHFYTQATMVEERDWQLVRTCPYDSYCLDDLMGQQVRFRIHVEQQPGPAPIRPYNAPERVVTIDIEVQSIGQARIAIEPSRVKVTRSVGSLVNTVKSEMMTCRRAFVTGSPRFQPVPEVLEVQDDEACLRLLLDPAHQVVKVTETFVVTIGRMSRDGEAVTVPELVFRPISRREPAHWGFFQR